MYQETFTVQSGIEIQTLQLEGWKGVLKPEVFEALREYAIRTNDMARSGYDVCRGSALVNFVNSYKSGIRL